MPRIALATLLALVTPILFEALASSGHPITAVLLGGRLSIALATGCLLLYFLLRRSPGRLHQFRWLFPALGLVCGIVGFGLEVLQMNPRYFQAPTGAIVFWGIGGTLAGWMFAMCALRGVEMDAADDSR